MKILSVLKSEYISLFFMTVFTLLNILNNQISVFYIIYLFWFHEFLRTVFKFGFYLFKREKIIHQHVYYENIKSKAFILTIYFIFIFIFFGLILDWKNSNLIFINLETFMFKNNMFNLTVVTFLVREFMLYFNDELKSITENVFLSKGIIVLHISIIIGMLIWGFLPIDFYENTNSNLLSGLVIAPFLFLKLFFEIKSIELPLYFKQF